MNDDTPPSILLVEDDASNRFCLQDFLTHQGYRCHEAANGLDGLRTLHAIPCDLVITDLDMPLMNGYQFLEALRRDPALSPIPVLMVTGHSLPEVTAHVQHLHVHTVLPKPYDFPQLTQILHTLFP